MDSGTLINYTVLDFSKLEYYVTTYLRFEHLSSMLYALPHLPLSVSLSMSLLVSLSNSISISLSLSLLL